MSFEELIKKSKELNTVALKQEIVNSVAFPFFIIVVATFISIRIFSYMFGWFYEKDTEKFNRQNYVLYSLLLSAVLCGSWAGYQKVKVK
jgi:uncharacterized membrane protein YbjE (DUF340 family)